jgi:hypothetical protein
MHPVDPIRTPRVEPATPTRRVVRRHEEPQDDGRRERRHEPEAEQANDEGEEPGGLHVDVLA